jgi:hypothetical protein
MAAFNDIDDGQYTAVVDSIEDGLATVFIEANGSDIGNAVIEAAELPEDGRHADAMLAVQIADGTVVEWEYDPDATETRRETAQDRFDRLSSRAPSDDEN